MIQKLFRAFGSRYHPKKINKDEHIRLEGKNKQQNISVNNIQNLRPTRYNLWNNNRQQYNGIADQHQFGQSQFPCYANRSLVQNPINKVPQQRFIAPVVMANTANQINRPQQPSRGQSNYQAKIFNPNQSFFLPKDQWGMG